MAYCMLIHLSTFGRPQVAYKHVFLWVGEHVSHAYKAASGAQGSWEIPLHSPSHPIAGYLGEVNQGCVTYGVMVRVPSGQESFCL